MGIDLLDLSFRIERTFGVHIEAHNWKGWAMQRQPPDIAVGEILEHIVNHLGQTRFPCLKCGYDLRAHGRTGRCPECGTIFEAWMTLQMILSDVLNVEPDEVLPDKLLIKDLGLT